MKSSSKFQVLNSTSEQKIRVFGKTLPDLFTNALNGMFKPMKPIFINTKKSTSHFFEVSGIDDDDLLVNFLNEALYLSLTNHESYSEVVFKEWSSEKICGIFFGRPISGFLEGEIKAVTHHDVHIINSNGILKTDIIFDV